MEDRLIALRLYYNPRDKHSARHVTTLQAVGLASNDRDRAYRAGALSLRAQQIDLHRSHRSY